jgi:alpha-1,2-mannosyltransferase
MNVAEGTPGAAPVSAVRRLAPFLSGGLLALTTGSVLASAGATLGYDSHAYLLAGQHVLNGSALYDPGVDVAVGYGVFLYPPPFALAAVPFALLPSPVGLAAWIGALMAAFVVGTVILPVVRWVRWSVFALAALSFPFLYAIKLGQVGPVLYLLFAVGWRWLDGPVPLGLTTAAAALMKVQPVVLFGWMLATRRWRAVVIGATACGATLIVTSALLGLPSWLDYLGLMGRIAKPITTPQNLTVGAILWRDGMSMEVATAVQDIAIALTLVVALFAAWRRDAATGFVVWIVAGLLLSPIVWSHYAMLLLLPVALLLERRQWWAVAIPLVTWLPVDLAYPAAFAASLLGPILTGTPAGRGTMCPAEPA